MNKHQSNEKFAPNTERKERGLGDRKGFEDFVLWTKDGARARSENKKHAR